MDLSGQGRCTTGQWWRQCKSRQLTWNGPAPQSLVSLQTDEQALWGSQLQGACLPMQSKGHSPTPVTRGCQQQGLAVLSVFVSAAWSLARRCEPGTQEFFGAGTDRGLCPSPRTSLTNAPRDVHSDDISLSCSLAFLPRMPLRVT